MIRLFIFLACVIGNREIPRRVEIRLELKPVEFIEPITSDEEGFQTA